MKVSLIPVLLLILLLTSCYPSRKAMESSPTWNVFDYSIPFKLKDTIQIKILDYIPAYCECGFLSCSSNCVGLTSTNDTIRVISLCNNNFSYTAGMQVWVAPVTYHIKKGESVIMMNRLNEPRPSAIQLKKYKTTDGQLFLKK